jgi:hypothetical protein
MCIYLYVVTILELLRSKNRKNLTSALLINKQGPSNFTIFRSLYPFRGLFCMYVHTINPSPKEMRQFFCLVSVEEFLQKPVTVPNEVDNFVFKGKLQGIST